MHLDTESCLTAVRAKDRRFDGVFYSAVTSTGIYCRPSCPAITPKPANLIFYPSAAAAQQGGFRACKRCRPDATPGSPEWNMRGDVASRALRLILDGTVEREGVAGLANRLGYSERQVQRILESELGATPLALARSQRARTARTLLESTRLAMGDVAYAAGFASIRQFNSTMTEVYAMTPSEIRRRSTTELVLGAPISIRLPVRQPFFAHGLLAHIVATAVPGVEIFDGEWYRRSLSLAHGAGEIGLRAGDDHVVCELTLDDLRDLCSAIARARSLLDLDADPQAIDSHLSRDRRLARLVSAAPGRRIPGTVDGSEWALRAVLGQQVSTASARSMTARVVERLGAVHEKSLHGICRRFPTVDAVANASDDALAMPTSRRDTLRRVAAAIANGDIDVSPGADRVETTQRLLRLKGIGPWTVGQIAMRALGDPDVLLESDLGVRASAARIGLRSNEGLVTRGEAWRPYRSYAVQYLWGTADHAINQLPTIERKST